MRPKSVKTVDEMIEKSYKCYCLQKQHEMLQATELGENLIVLANGLVMTADYASRLLVDGSKRGLVIIEDQLDSFLEKSKGTFKYTKLEETIMTDFYGFLMRDANNFMFEPFNRKLSHLLDSGIVKLIIQNSKVKPKLDEEAGPCQLAMSHLGIWFQIWIGFLSLASIVFVLEKIVERFQKYFRQKTFYRLEIFSKFYKVFSADRMRNLNSTHCVVSIFVFVNCVVFAFNTIFLMTYF
jgi:hypothetical protein